MSPCTQVRIGDTAAIICGPGRYSHLVRAKCPWCCLGRARTVHGFRFVHSGWCAPDLICGRCGQYWSADDERRRATNQRDREEHLAVVREMKGRLRVLRGFPLPPDLEEL